MLRLQQGPVQSKNDSRGGGDRGNDRGNDRGGGGLDRGDCKLFSLALSCLCRWFADAKASEFSGCMADGGDRSGDRGMRGGDRGGSYDDRRGGGDRGGCK